MHVIWAVPHIARLPSAQWSKNVQHPTLPQPQTRLSMNTGWQSMRVSQSARVVTSAQGGHCAPGQPPGEHWPEPTVHPGHPLSWAELGQVVSLMTP